MIRFNEALNVVSDINVSGYLFWLSAPSLVSEAMGKAVELLKGQCSMHVDVI